MFRDLTKLNSLSASKTLVRINSSIVFLNSNVLVGDPA